MDANPRRANLTPKEWLGLTMSILLFVVSMGGVCPDNFQSSSTETHLSSGERPSFRASLQADTASSAPGQQVSRTLRCQGTTPPGPVTFTWYPPQGAYGFTFDIAPINSSPPFIWEGLADDITQTVRFWMPPPPESVYLDSLRVRAYGGAQSTAIFRTRAITQPLRAASEVLPVSAPPSSNALLPKDVVPQWFLNHLTYAPGVTLTQSLCQEWAAFLQSDDAFVALRVPIAPTSAITEGYLSPIVFGWGTANAVRLRNLNTSATVFQVPLDLRLDRLTFLENTLPPADGEAWIALGGRPVTTNCPADLNLPSWGFETRAQLDLSFLPAYGIGRTVTIYYCYEGQDPPPVFDSLLARVGSYQGDGITCLGPQALPLTASLNPPLLLWELRGANSTWVTPTQSLALHHQIAPGNFAPFTVNVTYESDLGVSWGLYGGDWNEPDLNAPLTPPLLVTGFRDLWLVSDPLPANTPHGGYSLVITATNVLSPTDLRWAGDTIWVGDWVAPPPPPPPPPTYAVYLPLVLRLR